MGNDRMPGMNGPGPLTYGAIESYTRMTGTVLRYWEVDALKLLDHVYRTT